MPDRHAMPPDQVGARRPVLAVVDSLALTLPLDPLMSFKALAAYASLSPRTLRGCTELPPDQALPCYRLLGKTLVRRSDFDAWLEQYRTRGRPSLVKALRELGLDRAGSSG